MGLLEIYFQNKDNWSAIACKCRTKFGGTERATLPDIRKFITKVRETVVIFDASRRVCAHTVCAPENIEAVAEDLLKTTSNSTDYLSQKLNISRPKRSRCDTLQSSIGLRVDHP